MQIELNQQYWSELTSVFSLIGPELKFQPAKGPNLKGPPMTSIQRLALLALMAFSTVAIAQQTPPSNPPPPQPGSQTTTTTTTTQDSAAPGSQHDQDTVAPAPIHDRSLDAPTPLTKRELKDQRRRQKQTEKSAGAHADAEKHSAKADKENAKAMKQENKSEDAAEKANAPQ